MLSLLPPVVDMQHLYSAIRARDDAAGNMYRWAPLFWVSSNHFRSEQSSPQELELFANDTQRRARLLCEKKHRVTGEYLALVESTVDSFLRSHYGFDHEAVPFNYLDQKPEDLQIVEDNLDTLLHCVSDVFHPNSLIQTKLIQPLVLQVWRDMLHPLHKELRDLQERILVKKSFFISKHVQGGGKEGQQQGVVEAASVQVLEHVLAEIAADIAYIDIMRQHERSVGSQCEEEKQEGDSNERRSSPASSPGARPQQRLADQVPIGGLIVNRLHRLENEHRTVLDHWAGR